MLPIPEISSLSITPEAKKHLQEGGSKAGVYNFLNQSDLASGFRNTYRNIFPEHTHILKPEDEDVAGFLKQVTFDGTPYIVRGRHPEDFMGAVDVFDTHTDTIGVFTSKRAQECITNIREKAQSDLVKSFMSYDTGKPYDGKAGIMIQEYYGPQVGSVIEHPFDPGIYIVEKSQFGGCYGEAALADYKFFEETPEYTEIDMRQVIRKPKRKFIDLTIASSLQTYVYDTHQKTINGIPVMEAMAEYGSDVQGVNEMSRLYKTVKETGLVPSNYSFKVDFGIPVETFFMESFVKLYQVTLFRTLEQKAPRSRPRRSYSTDLHKTIGITPEEGIELSFAHIGSKEHYASDDKRGYRYKNKANDLHVSTPLDIQPKNIEAYIGLCESMLEHGHFRWIKKAPVSMVTGNRFPRQNSKVRLYANGVQARREDVE